MLCYVMLCYVILLKVEGFPLEVYNVCISVWADTLRYLLENKQVPIYRNKYYIIYI